MSVKDANDASCRLVRPGSTVLGIAFLAILLAASPAWTQHCSPSTVPGTFIGFTPKDEDVDVGNSCNLLPCHKPERDGGTVIELEDGVARLTVPLELAGNRQLPNNAHHKVFWFLGPDPQPEDEDDRCLPPPGQSDCTPISICGLPGTEILTDKGNAWIQITCNDVLSHGLPPDMTFSLSAYACLTESGECTERLDVPNLILPPPAALFGLMGCDLPPPECDQWMCGPGDGAAGGGPPGQSVGGSGPKAILSYKGRGAGHSGFPGEVEWKPQLGRYWSHDYAERLVPDPDRADDMWLITRFAAFHRFRDTGNGIYRSISPSDDERMLVPAADGWRLESHDGSVQSFDAAGLWLDTTDRHGNAKQAIYADGVLSEVHFPDGRRESFAYHSGGKLASITEIGVDNATSLTWSYTWVGLDLVRIDRPDGTAWAFAYGDPRHPGFMTRMTLVGTDQRERVDGAWDYDARGNVVRSWKGDPSFNGPDATERFTFGFDNPYVPEQATVTDALGQVTVYKFSRDPQGIKPRLEERSGSCGSCGRPESQLFYEDPAHPMRITRELDAKGTATLFQYDSNGRRTAVTEAAGTPLARTTRWEYHPDFPSLVTAIEQPSTSGTGVRRTSWVYDGGDPIRQIREGFENGSSFHYETAMTYNAAGQLETVDLPGFGTADRKSLTYDPARGNLIATSLTEPLVGTTSFGHDPFNRRSRVTEASGLVTETTYDSLDRVLTQVRKGATAAEDLVTIHTYNSFGDLHQVIFPAGNVFEYGRDSSGRVTSVELKPDVATPGERTVYTLNGLGQRVREELQRWEGGAWVTHTSRQRLYSAQCRLDAVVHGDGSLTELGSDCDGRQNQEWDPNHPSDNRQNPPSRQIGYDVLGRVTTLIQPWGGQGGGSHVVRMKYDVQDHLVEVTDANGNVTSSTYSDRDLKTQETSPVAGTTRMTYNEHGRLVQSIDGRGVIAERTVDELGRLTFVDYPGESLDTSYVYDDPAVPFSTGLLTAVIRGGRRIDYRYDRFEMLIQDGDLTYEYDKNGNRSVIRQSDGVEAIYSYDFADRPASLSVRESAGESPRTVVAAATYLPEGPLDSLTLGNGLTEIRSFTPRYFPAAIRVPGRLDWTYSTDGVGNVVTIVDALDVADSRSYLYQDYQYFLTRAEGPWGEQAWTYDRIGNPLTEVRGSETTLYTYESGTAGGNTSRLLATLTGNVETLFAYDSGGNAVLASRGDRKIRYRYDATGRISEMRSDRQGETLATVLRYDGRGFLDSSSRTSPSLASGAESSTEPTYDSDGLLHHRRIDRARTPRTPRGGAAVRGDDYIFYFAGRPVAQLSEHETQVPGEAPVDSSELLFLTTDHLGTPVLLTDGSGALRWRGGFDPFGGDFAQARQTGVFLGLPGQWQDATWSELAPDRDLLYNVHRWYVPGVGRYLRPDPLATGKGLDAYAYASRNPLRFVDPLGLRVTLVEPEWRPFLGCALATGSDDFKEAWEYLELSDDDWELRTLKEGAPMGSNARSRFKNEDPGQASNTEPPGLFRPTGRIWIDPRRPLACESIMKSLVHEVREAFLKVSGRQKTSVGAHYAVTGWDFDEARSICKRCCPVTSSPD